MLYIPLRSDKTTTRWGVTSVLVSFISHYVQIKPQSSVAGKNETDSFISHYVQIKPCTEQCLNSVINLYIPLRSDKTSKTLPYFE